MNQLCQLVKVEKVDLVKVDQLSNEVMISVFLPMLFTKIEENPKLTS